MVVKIKLMQAIRLTNLILLQVDVPDSLFLSILDMVALNLRLNRAITSQADTIRMYALAVTILNWLQQSLLL